MVLVGSHKDYSQVEAQDGIVAGHPAAAAAASVSFSYSPPSLWGC